MLLDKGLYLMPVAAHALLSISGLESGHII